jgi:hypothetical protein
VPRSRSPEIAVRNEVIYAKWRTGQSLVSLGEEYGRAPQVIGRVVASFHPEGDDDGERALFRGYLWRLLDEVRGVYDAPGWKMSPTGKPAEGPDGEPAEDVMAKIEAAKLQLGIMESLRKLDARDRPVTRNLQISVPDAQRAKEEDLARRRAEMQSAALTMAERQELEAYRMRATPLGPVVAGEVVREPGL